MTIFIVFVKFLSWIVTIRVRLAKLIGKKEGLKFRKGSLTTKIKYIITIHIYIYIYTYKYIYIYI